MADDFNSKLNGLLSNPAAMQQIMSMASGLMNAPKSQADSQISDFSENSNVPFGNQNMQQNSPQNPPFPDLPRDDRCELLGALRPFLKDRRAEKIDLMIRILQIVNLTKRR